MTVAPAAPVAPSGVVAARRRTVPDLAGLSRNRPSFYADPLAWLVAATVEELLLAAPAEPALEPDEVGVIVVSSARSLPTARPIAESTARGRVSPLRFAGGNPGILAGLSCIQHGFRGPSMVLTAADPADPAPSDAALALAASWLAGGQARHVVCVRHAQAPEDGPHTVAAVLLGPAADRPGPDPHAALAP
ncbi:beta-ketoacyl synthase N-terminal-like domain-containing protein [Kitasatospora sp. NPDC004531]